MPYPIPFVWSRERGTTLASRSAQQTARPGVTVHDPTTDIRLLNVQQFWLTQQRRRDWTMNIWYARGLYAGLPLPSLRVQAQALGAGDEAGAEIVADDYILARLSGVGGYSGIGTAPLDISSSVVNVNTMFSVDFRLAIPDTATTLGRFNFRLVFNAGAGTPWYGAEDSAIWFERGGYYELFETDERIRIEKGAVMVSGFIYTAAQRTSLAAGGLDLPNDTIF